MIGVVGVALSIPQTARADGRLEASARSGWWSGYALGTREATITGGQVPAGSPVVIFTTDTTLEGGPAAEIGLGWRLARGVVLEANGGLGQAHLEARIRGDIEGAPAVTTRSSLLQVIVDGGARIELPASFGHGRVRPFISGGGGYLRQVHERRLLIETGRTVFAGVGLIVAPASGPSKGLLRRIGFRADIRVTQRSGGADIEDAARRFVALTGGALVRF